MNIARVLGQASVPWLVATAIASSAQAETRGYIISWFGTATQVADFKENCPEDRNGGGAEWMIRDLISIGYPPAQARRIAAGEEMSEGIRQKLSNRAVVNGKHVSVYNYPDAVPDPNIETVTGKYAYGFDLGGANPAAKFEDPETGGKVDNQLWRAIGCTAAFRAEPPELPFPEHVSWTAMLETSPGWSIMISGDDLGKDGDVTVTLDRLTQHPERDANGDIMSAASYIIDPAARSHNELRGRIEGGVLTIEPADIYLQSEMPFYPEIALTNAHMRMKLQPDGKLVGYWGGYFGVLSFNYMMTSRPGHGADAIGIYHAVKKMADADPDPITGQNRKISSTWRVEAVPAYLLQTDGHIVADAVMHTAGVSARVANAGGDE